VADADGDSDGYQQLLGKLFTKDKPAPVVTPATDAATVEPIKVAARIEPPAAKPAPKPAHAGKEHPEHKAEAKKTETKKVEAKKADAKP